MRLAIAAWSVRQAGGVEAYVAHMSSALAARGHDVSLWYQTENLSAGHGSIPPNQCMSPRWSRCEPRARSNQRMAAIVLLDGPGNPFAPGRPGGHVYQSVLIAHNYHGISSAGPGPGTRPHVQPCTRPLAAVLSPTFPGGQQQSNDDVFALSLTSKHLDVARRCAAVVTLSDHMRKKSFRQGMPTGGVLRSRPFRRPPAASGPPPPGRVGAHRAPRRRFTAGAHEGRHVGSTRPPASLDRLDRPVTLTIIGDARDGALGSAAADRGRRVPPLAY